MLEIICGDVIDSHVVRLFQTHLKCEMEISSKCAAENMPHTHVKSFSEMQSCLVTLGAVLGIA